MESTIDIISVGGTTNTVVIGQGSVRHYELMSSDYVRLVFSTDKKINIRIGDHIATKEWGTFYITKLQRSTYNKSTGGFDYDLQFDAPYYLWNNRLYKYDPKNNRNEASWSLTDNLKNHMAVFLRSLSYYGWTYTVDAASYSLEEAQRTVYISFQNKYLLDALSQIAESFNLEYWITDNIIHFGKAESGTAVDFKLGDNVEEMSAENSESDGANRFYAFGSTQNIPSGYRSSESEVILNGVVQNRLMLPKDTPYIDLDSGLKAEEVVDGIVTFDDVYPRTKSSVSEVIKVSKTVEKSNTVEATTDTSAVADDSKAETEVVNIYRFKTSDFNFSADYILANTSLQVQFVSGKLNGMTFEVAFNPNGENEKTIVDGKTVVNPDSQLFELVRNDTYGLTLPNDTLFPAVGDKFVLLGWDANKLTAWKELITKAEEELKSKLEAYVAKKRIDPLTYVCTMMSDYMYGLDANGKQDPNFSKVGSFPIGQAIRLHSDVYFKDGMRESRVIGYEYKLDLPFDAAQIYVGESPIYSNSKATQNAINEATSTIINYLTGNTSSGSIGISDLYKQIDWIKRHKLDKIVNDIAEGLITFKQGLVAIGLSLFQNGAQFGTFVKSLYAGTGAAIDKQGNTEVESIRVRSYAEIMELIVNRLSAIEGDQLLTEADTIESVTADEDGTYTLKLKSKWEGYFTAQAENNVLKGIMNTLAKGSGEYHTAWFRVNSVNTANNSINVSMYPDNETPAGKNFPPEEMMKIARWGNQTDTTRQSCLYLSSTEGRIVKLVNVTKPIIDKENYGATLGSLPDFVRTLTDDNGNLLPIREGLDYLYAPGIVTMDIIRLNKWTLKRIPTYVDRGKWKDGEKYYCEAENPATGEYETSDVWYYGCKWRCCKNLTTTAPSWNNTDWAMVEGNPDFSVDFAEAESIVDPDKINVPLTLVAKLYNMDVTDDIKASDVEWTRYSEDASGNERTALDNAWSLKHADSGKSIVLTKDDMDMGAYMPKVIRFTATATLRDGEGNAAAKNSVTYDYE